MTGDPNNCGISAARNTTANRTALILPIPCIQLIYVKQDSLKKQEVKSTNRIKKYGMKYTLDRIQFIKYNIGVQHQTEQGYETSAKRRPQNS